MDRVPPPRRDHRLAAAAEHDLFQRLAGGPELADHFGPDMGDRRRGQGVQDTTPAGTRTR